MQVLELRVRGGGRGETVCADLATVKAVLERVTE